jgi:hypothetical protein
MASCLFFNVQVNPLNAKTHNLIGDVGYQSMGKNLKEKTDDLMKSEHLHNYGYALSNSDFYIVPIHLKLDKEYLRGTFRRYDQVKRVNEFYSDEELYKVPKEKSATSKITQFPFVFDYKNHVLVVENKENKLPSVSTLQDVIYHFFKDICINLYPHHEVTCMVIKEKAELERVIESERFKYIRVDVSYTNNYKIDEELESLFDKDMRDAGVGSNELIQRPEKNGEITRITRATRALLSLAGKNGDAEIRYYDKNSKGWKKFFYKNFPIKISIRNSAEMPLHMKMFRSIKEALKRAS